MNNGKILIQKLFFRLARCLSVYLLFCCVFNLSHQGLPQLNEIYSFPVLENFVSFCNWNTVIFRTVWLGHLIDFSLTVSVNRSTSACFAYTYTHIAHLIVPIPASDCPAALVFSHVRRFATCSPLASCGPPGSSVHGILQERILEWVTISSHRGSSWPRDRTCFSCVSCIAGRFFTVEQLWKPISDCSNL